MSHPPLLRLLQSPADGLRERDAGELAERLGRAAPWLLRDEVVRRLAEEWPALRDVPLPFRPELPGLPGSCVVLYVTPSGDYPLARPAFALPWRWRSGGRDDPGLPGKLRDLAARVRKHVGVEGSWSLHRLPPFLDVNLADLDEVLDHRSGWAPLAGALLLGIEGGRPRPEVWASGCWNEGIEDVDGLGAKLGLAREWGCRELHVPETARAAADAVLKRSLRAGLRSPADSLRDYLAALDAPPAGGADPAQRVAYWHRQGTSERGKAFYRDRILPDVVRERRAQVEREFPGCAPSHLVTVVSNSTEVARITADSLNVRHCLLLRTGDMEKESDQLELDLGGRAGDPVTITDDGGMFEGMRAAVAAFARDVPGEKLAFDMTPGTKLMTLALERLARQGYRGSWLVYLRNEQPGGRREPFRVRLECWRANDEGGPFNWGAPAL